MAKRGHEENMADEHGVCINLFFWSNGFDVSR